MNKKPNIVRPIGAKPTQEQAEIQAKRAFYQKRNAVAETILFNAVAAGAAKSRRPNYKPLIDAAVEGADYLMAKLYSVSIQPAPKEEPKTEE